MSKPKRIAVIGGGITGLSAAYYLQKEIHAEGLNVNCVLYEGADTLGGKIKTEYFDDFVIENGPDSFLARKTSAAELGAEVGLEQDLVYNNATKSYILHGGELYPMPGGAIMGIPTQWGPFLSTRLLSPMGKIRAAADLVLPRSSKNGSDQSLGHFFRNRLGGEVVDRLIEPLLSGIYAGNIDRLSLQATFPQFQQMEEQYRSLVVGMKSSLVKRGHDGQKRTTVKKNGMFQTFKGGLNSLVTAIADHLDEGAVHTGTPVTKINKENNGYTLSFSDGRIDQVDRIILTTPHQVTAKLFDNMTIFDEIKDVPSTSVATVVLAFDPAAIKKDIDGSGFVVSKKSNYKITACTWTNKKWSHSAPDDRVLLRAYVGRAGEEEIVDRQDEEIIATVLQDLNHIMELEGEPEFYRITRWRNAMPQYLVGHKDRLLALKAEMKKELPGVYLAGASYEGIGIPDCIDQAKKAAGEALL